MRARERGAGLLIPVLLVITVAAFAVIVAASGAGGDVQGSNANAHSLQALYLAETGVERALKRYATGTACGAALVQTITNLNTIGLGTTSHQIEILAGLPSDFSGAPLVSSQTQCRVRATGTVLASNVSRTIHAIVDRNVLPGANNHNFNNPTVGGPDAAWTLSPLGTFQNNGGPDGTFPNCRRSAWLWIDAAAASTTASGLTNIPIVPVPVTVAAPSVTTVHFHRRIVNRGAGCAVFAGAAAFACPAAAQGGTICFQMDGTGPGNPWTSTNHTVNPGVTLGAVACPYAPNPCQTNYNPPVYPAKSNVTITIAAGAPARRNVTSFAYSMRLQDTVAPQPVYAGARELFLDNIEAVNTTALDAARVLVWRDCSTAVDPVNCI
jgi:hypothetical protein